MQGMFSVVLLLGPRSLQLGGEVVEEHVEGGGL